MHNLSGHSDEVRLYPFMPYSLSNKHTTDLDKHCLGLNAHIYAEPPWENLKKHCSEAEQHYSKLYKLTFLEGCGPLEALEKLWKMSAAS
jgi:hypothetical protein